MFQNQATIWIKIELQITRNEIFFDEEELFEVSIPHISFQLFIHKLQTSLEFLVVLTDPLHSFLSFWIILFVDNGL